MLKRPKSLAALSMILFSTGTVSSGHAADFFTIIGPDGRPLVIQRNDASTANKPKQVTQSQQSQKQKTKVPEPARDKKQTVIETPNRSVQTRENIGQSKVDTPSPSKETVHQNIISPQVVTSQPEIVSKKNTSITTSPVVSQKQSVQASSTQKMETDIVKVPTVQEVPPVKLRQAEIPVVTAKKDIREQAKPSLPAETPHKEESSNYISEINGEKYVNNEYLEEKEFNLEGKKRFYMMPEGVVDSKLGAVKMLPVEREKGVSKSFLSNVLKNKQKDAPMKASALSATYYRMPKEQVVENLETSCFSGEKINEAKKFDVKKQVGLWPRKPLKDTFDYDVVKLSAPLTQLKLTSYATTDQNPTFYWPFVVFLDQQGCILEGVSGYKNQEYAATMLQHAAIEGTIRLPEGTSYILMTPLASALDVQEKSLSNQGQIKLTAIR